MSQQLTGKVLKVLPYFEKGNFKATPIVLEYMNGEKELKAYIQVTGQNAKEASLLNPGVNITVDYSINASEYGEGKWFNNLNVWKFKLN